MAGENESGANGADLVIAGGGLIGLACSLEAAGSGLDVAGSWGNFDGDELSFDAWQTIVRGVKR